MERETDPDVFLAAPRGRYYLGPCWLVWCWNEELCGSIVWGRPSAEETRQLLRLFEMQHALAPKFDSLTDPSRMSLVAPSAFAVVVEEMRRGLPIIHERMRRSALVLPAGLLGAAIAGLYPLVIGPGLSWKAVGSITDGLAWFDTDSARAAAPELARLIELATGHSSLLHQLQEYLREHLFLASLDGAALALGTSRRSLQRQMAQAKTSFSEQVMSVRIEEARRLLIESDAKLEAIGIDLGFSSVSHFISAFVAATGETPGKFRARYRG